MMSITNIKPIYYCSKQQLQKIQNAKLALMIHCVLRHVNTSCLLMLTVISNRVSTDRVCRQMAPSGSYHNERLHGYGRHACKFSLTGQINKVSEVNCQRPDSSKPTAQVFMELNCGNCLKKYRVNLYCMAERY